MIPILVPAFCRKNRRFLSILCLLAFLELILLRPLFAQSPGRVGKFYISASGNDRDPGTKRHPWNSILALNRTVLKPGDSVFFEGGKSFRGTILLDSSDRGTREKKIWIGSYGRGRAIIQAQNQTAIRATRSACLVISGLVLRGNGRKNGNTGRGVFLERSNQAELYDLDISGFQKSGVELKDCSDIRLERIHAHDNGFAGIAVTGNSFPHITNHRIYIGHCKAVNNPGDPTELKNHSGNGIVVGLASGVLIEYCVATANGWDMPRKGNGPVGIWAWEADSVTIQFCISYRNRTAPGAADGGGFDLDGGVTHSLVQYNLAYENEGYGFGIFQFSGASPWHDNVFRYNLSYNDGNTAPNGASILWWNGSRDSSQFHDCYVYQNLLYNTMGYTLGVVPGEYENSRFLFLNNIFVCRDEFMRGGLPLTEQFYGNDWWSLQSGFRMNGQRSFAVWAANASHEWLDGRTVGSNQDPRLKHPAVPLLTNPDRLQGLTGFQLKEDSPLRGKGLDIRRVFQIDPGPHDFFGNALPRGPTYEPGIFELK